MSALLSFQKENNLTSYIIESAVLRNDNVDRVEKDWASDKGRAVE